MTSALAASRPHRGQLTDRPFEGGGKDAKEEEEEEKEEEDEMKEAMKEEEESMSLALAGAESPQGPCE